MVDRVLKRFGLGVAPYSSPGGSCYPADACPVRGSQIPGMNALGCIKVQIPQPRYGTESTRSGREVSLPFATDAKKPHEP